jgi:hypothetical protein
MKKKLVEGVDFYYNEMGYIVLTAAYHLEKGNCCGNGCTNCPYNYINVAEPRRSELQARKQHAEAKESNI